MYKCERCKQEIERCNPRGIGVKHCNLGGWIHVNGSHFCDSSTKFRNDTIILPIELRNKELQDENNARIIS